VDRGENGAPAHHAGRRVPGQSGQVVLSDAHHLVHLLLSHGGLVVLDVVNDRYDDRQRFTAAVV